MDEGGEVDFLQHEVQRARHTTGALKTDAYNVSLLLINIDETVKLDNEAVT